MYLPFGAIILYEAVIFGVGLKLDYERGTTKHTVENLYGVAGAVAGGLLAAKGVTWLLPDLGKSVGTMVGATFGGITGDKLVRDKLAPAL